MKPTQPPPDQPSPRAGWTPVPGRILSEPATPQTCAADLRTPTEQQTAAGAARDQAAFTRIHAAGR